MNRITGDTHVEGLLTARTMTIPANALRDSGVAADADIAYSKLQHLHGPTYSQAAGSVSVSEKRTMHIVVGASGSVLSFAAGSATVCTGNATITVDLLKNGVSCLQAALVLNSAKGAYSAYDAVITSAALAAGDRLEVQVTVNAGTGALGNGVFARLRVSEKAS